MGELLLVLDEGTTSTRAMLFAPSGECLGSRAAELTQSYPGPGLVEHDAAQIWQRTLACARAMVDKAGGADRIAAIGITNQRETIVFWDKITGEPLAPAIVWQDRRSAALCRQWREAGEEPGVQARTGLLLDPYFSGTKIAWAMANWPQLAEAGDRLAIGTIESWLVWKLTAGEDRGGLHITDATNASRTLLMGLGSGGWSDGLLDMFSAPRSALPEIVDCAGRFGTTRLFGGEIPICGLAGDQQAATVGQACFAKGDTKATYGTGAFVLTNAGTVPPSSKHRLLATVLWQLGGRRTYAIEGSVFVAGSLIQWLRDSVGLIDTAPETEALARSVPDNGGVYLVPALSGLGAPWWEPDARAALSGLSFASTRAHIVRAALEAMAHQSHDLETAFAADGADWARLRVDGGMVTNDWMAQDLADMLALPVDRPDFAETTALGAAMLAGVGCGLFGGLGEAAAMRGPGTTFEPKLSAGARQTRLAGWTQAVQNIVTPAKAGAHLPD
ncbi:glycerol kinase [Sphingomonas naasensis]|uniref:Glycerol kinase n=1 Tax=Sphingomonas naasensis TaxID=1344951 RepID=A0A4S1WLV9_9SPHN|nr:glycerol kinase [Sphingomonas naasensis]NIJ20097.1 glycerol kinase [Sphingomonas naasensis]TGX44251.1 glycerol kinase [Sphingomonas naasensis]